MTKPQRPERFDFAMDFIGNPERSEVEAYVTMLETKVTQARGLLERALHSIPDYINGVNDELCEGIDKWLEG